MPRATRQKAHRSTHFPDQLDLLTIDGEPLPELGKWPHRHLLALGHTCWRLYRARQRIKRDQELADRLRTEVIENFTGIFQGLYGFRVHRKRSLEVLVVDRHSDKIIDPLGVIANLGPHAADIVTGVVLPIDKLLGDPANYARLLELIKAEFGTELAQLITITINRERHNRLVKDGELEPLPDSVFQRIVGSKQVRVTLLDQKVIKTPTSVTGPVRIEQEQEDTPVSAPAIGIELDQ